VTWRSDLLGWFDAPAHALRFGVGWYLRFVLSYRDMEELLAERGFLVDHVTVWRWVQRYVPEMERRLRSRLKPTSDSWRVDSELHPVMGKWGYLYRAVQS
jgi:IS6 family transposase